MFIPIGDDNSRVHRTPYVVWTVFILNCLVWLLQLKLGDQFTYGFSMVPLEISTGVDLVRPQLATIAGSTVEIPQAPGPGFIYLSIFSSMFMHGSWMHIIGNMAYLLIFGDQIEDELGHLRFLLFYLACGVAASMAQFLTDTQSIIPCLGASGAIAGVLGAYLIRHPQNSVRVFVLRSLTTLPAFIVLGGWIVLQFFSQVTVSGHSGVAYMAHIGGFLAGVLFVFLFGLGQRRRR